jgi:CheY-like chemotaxis protein
MDGDAFAVLDSFKARGEHVPAVIITADPRDEVADHALAMGVTVLHKPIDANDVKRFLDGVGVGPGGMAAA